MFETIRLDEELAKDWGLTPASLERLGAVVAIAGPNGAGKTRLLKLIYEQLGALREVFERLSKIARAFGRRSSGAGG